MSMLNWPSGFDRTPEHERESGSKFDVGYRQTKSELKNEMDLLGADEWRLDEVSGRQDPGVVLRWMKHDQEHAVACDHYAAKKANLRCVYLWVNETRMRSQRPVEHAEDEFAAARLPPGDEADDVVVAGAANGELPHEVLEVAPDAPEDVVEAAYRAKAQDAHADQGGSTERMTRLNKAKERILDG